MNIESLNEIIEKSGLSKIGLRVMTGGKVVKVGDDLDNSFDWVDGCITSEEIDGTCALDLGWDGWEIDEGWLSEMLTEAKAYNMLNDNEQLVVIGGREGFEGNDVNEIVIENAVCLAVF